MVNKMMLNIFTVSGAGFFLTAEFLEKIKLITISLTILLCSWFIVHIIEKVLNRKTWAILIIEMFLIIFVLIYFWLLFNQMNSTIGV